MEESKEYGSIPFITFDKTYEVNPEAIRFLSQFKEKIGVIAICGKYRTGKSYLLNRIIEDKVKERNTDSDSSLSFNVGPTVNACTKGLWLLSKPIYINKNGKEVPVIVIDTEGLGAIDEEQNHDSKIFLLALLLSSLFIYNSVGTIDENALNSLSLGINLSSQIEDLGEYFPSFLWVLRDFSLKLEDEQGNEISSKMYLDLALKEQKGSSDNIESKNRIRRMIKHFFTERDLSVLVRPTESEADLQNLPFIPNEDLRTQFVKGVSNLKNRVFKKVPIKKLNDQFINGRMLADLAISYAKSLNQGSIPQIGSAWDYVCDSENLKGLEAAFKALEKQVKEVIPDLPMDDNLLLNYKNTVFKDIVKIFNEASLIQEGQNREIYIEKIVTKLEEEYTYLIKENKNITKQVLDTYFTQNFKPLVTENLKQEMYQSFQDYDKEVEYFKITFVKDMQGKATNVELLIDQIFLRYNSLVYREISSSKHRNMELELAATRERLRIAEEDIQRQRKEITECREHMQTKIMKLENDRVHLSVQNQVMNEKLLNKDKEKELAVIAINEKYNDANERLQKYENQNLELSQKFDNLKDQQIAKEGNFIIENSKILARMEFAENEVEFLKKQLDKKDDKIDDLETHVDSLTDTNDELQRELSRTQTLNDHDMNVKEVEKFKLDFDHVSKQKENIEVNFLSLKKENIGILNKNSMLVEQKNMNHVLTNKLLENLKSKLIEKHESN
jgi:hypothetical protein